MFENLIGFFKKMGKKEGQIESKNNKDEAKERLHLVLMQDRANVSADFLDMMRQEIIDVIKKYIDVEDGDIDVRLTNKQNGDGTTGAPALYANIPIKSIKNETRKMSADINKENKQNKEEKEEIKEVEEKTTDEETKEENKKVENIEQDKKVKEEGEKNNQEESNKSNNEIKNENNTPKANNKNKIAPKANVSKEKNNKKKK